jgi:4-aminobutyrate aminotransferase/(S)-3-amino-2-methylpropionate transaminase
VSLQELNGAVTRRAINIKTAIPGPLSTLLAARRNEAVPAGIAHSTPIYLASGSSALLVDVDGNRFIDFTGGIGVLNVGHSNPRVVSAAVTQARQFTHASFSVTPYELYVALAEKLNAITPGSFKKKTILSNSGAEAVENAVKIARHATGRPGVVVFEHAFHGRTLLALTMTSKIHPYKEGFGPFVPDVYRLPFPYAYRDSPERAAEVASSLENFFLTHASKREIACVVIELVLGEGGFLVAPAPFVRSLSDVCRKHGILLIVDEIQTGFGRTGAMFASDHYGLEPDIILTAKSLGGGFPIAGTTGRAAIMDNAQVGGLGGTFAGNPVCCAAALEAVKFIEENRLSERAAEIGRVLDKKFKEFVADFDCVGDARGLGAMRAIEIVRSKETKEPDKARAQQIIKSSCENGLVLMGAGTHGNVVRTLMPLTISDDQLNEGLGVLERCIRGS